MAYCQDYSYSDYTGAKDENDPQSQQTLTKSTTNNAKEWNKLKFSTYLNTSDIKKFTTGGDGKLTVAMINLRFGI